MTVGPTPEDLQDPFICVVTVTRGRGRLLQRAMESVREQTFNGRIEHLIIVDDDDASVRQLAGLRGSTDRQVRCVNVPRSPGDGFGESDGRASVYPRLSRLFNEGARQAAAPWISYLDDDNEYAPDHLAELFSLAQKCDSPAVHSGRSIVWPDGSPYLSPVFPWAADRSTGLRIHALLCERGVWLQGTNILLDQVDTREPTFRNSTVMLDGDPTFLVDQSVWLLRRDLVLEMGFPEVFSDDEIAENTCPDDKFLEQLVRAGVRIVSSNRPTVRYFLGGVSNDVVLIN